MLCIIEIGNHNQTKMTYDDMRISLGLTYTQVHSEFSFVSDLLKTNQMSNDCHLVSSENLDCGHQQWQGMN